MCGIAGYFLDRPVDREELSRMTRALAHRGPDGEGFFTEGGAGLGHRRLSIIDLKTGNQPMFNEDGSVAAVFNGEIYNYRELREELKGRGHAFSTESDTEVIVHLYEEEGELFPEKLNGIFAFALYDRKRKKLVLARDPMGVKPLYYALDGDGVTFASELKALSAGGRLRLTEDREALYLYLQMEYYPAPLTPFREARKLLPGHLLVAETPRDTRIARYAGLRFCDLSALTEEETAERVRAAVSASVKRQLVSDVPLGLFLSGGVDSSSVAAAMKLTGADVRSFSIGFADGDFDESGHARRAARHLGTIHSERIFTEKELVEEVPRVLSRTDEPLADPSLIPTSLLSRFARQEVKVALGGDGGDELFCGYPTYLVHRHYRLYRLCPGFVRRAAMKAVLKLLPAGDGNLTLPFKAGKFWDGAEKEMPERHLAWMGAFNREKLSSLLPGAAPDFSRLSWIPPAPRDDAVTEAEWLDLHTYLMEDVLQKVDRMSMLSSLEVRVPLLDPEVAGLAFSIPPSMKMGAFSLKKPLKKAFERDLPPRFFNRPKKGFAVPMSRWLKGPLRETARDHLDAAAKHLGIRADGPRTLLEDHLKGRADNRKLIWTLVTLAAWKENLKNGTD